jgi:hypothetical protein
MEADLHGASTRKVVDLVKAFGADSGISKSEAARICAGLDAEVAMFRDRSRAGAAFPYVFVDATDCWDPGEPPRGIPGPSWSRPGSRRQASRGPRVRRGRQRGRSVLDRVPAVVEGPRAARGAAGDLRRPRRPRVRDRRGLRRCDLAAVPGALPAQHARPGPRGNAEMVAAAVRTIFASPTPSTSTPSSTSSPGCSASSSQSWR